MKNTFNSILLLTLVGIGALACGAVYFGAPLFGWIIMAAIFVVFLAEQFMSMAAARKISAEEEQIAACESGRGFRVSGDGVVARRLEMARHLVEKGIRIDSPIAYEVLSNSTGLPAPRSSSGTVILLGLMGTFFGLMYSVATAGGAIDNSTTQGTLDTIQVLFQNMKGIFGTSLCGLFAALVLNASRSLLLGARERFLARLDSLTLELQGEDAAASATDMEKTELERLFQSVEKNLSAVAASVQQGLAKTVESLESAVSNSMNSVSAKLDEKLGAVASTTEKAMGSISTKLDEKLGAVASATENAMSASSKNIANAVADQVKQSSEQWKAFMDKLSTEASAGVQSQDGGVAGGRKSTGRICRTQQVRFRKAFGPFFRHSGSLPEAFGIFCRAAGCPEGPYRKHRQPGREGEGSYRRPGWKPGGDRRTDAGEPERTQRQPGNAPRRPGNHSGKAFWRHRRARGRRQLCGTPEPVLGSFPRTSFRSAYGKRRQDPGNLAGSQGTGPACKPQGRAA